MTGCDPQPLICVRDVEASSRWYQRLLGCASDHGGPNYERLVIGGRLVLQLHRWEEEHHHGRIGDPADLPPGNGLLLWFEVDDFDAAVARAESMGPRLSYLGTAIRRTETAGRTIGRFGCVTPTATRSCWRVPTGRQTESGDPSTRKRMAIVFSPDPATNADDVQDGIRGRVR